MGPSFVGLRIHSYENDSFNPVNNKSRFVILDLKGNKKLGKLFIYDKKGKTWSESSIGQGDPVNFLAMGTPNNTSGLCTVTKNESGILTFYVYKY
ncbi:MAG: hypothetical protein EBT07_19050 [Actinobacteria bacterium]|nr:hypothetical protein [Actinomycetota bacterium]